MKRTIANLFLVLGSVCIGALELQAQSYSLSMTVPFAFHVNGTTCSSGRYVFQKAANHEVESLRNRDTGRSLFLGVAPQSKVNHGSPRLVYHRYGNEYFLSEVWNDQGTGTRLHMSRLEKQMHERTAEANATTATVYMAHSR